MISLTVINIFLAKLIVIDRVRICDGERIRTEHCCIDELVLTTISLIQYGMSLKGGS